jgi:large repetitive protein
MRNFTLFLAITLVFVLCGTQSVFSQGDLPAINFSTFQLEGTQFGDNPTSLQFGPDGRLYVAEQNGVISIYTIERDDAAPGSGVYTIVDVEIVKEVKNKVPNHNDDGAANSNNNRQMTGILVTGTAEAPVIYATSSDWRIGGGGSGSDLNLDTNSGVISRLTKTASGWEKVDLVRGLPRCEENHATNGLAISGSTLLVQSGGHTNKGAPSNNFSGTPEYMLSGVLLRVDLAQLESMPVYTDPRSNTKYVYDLPTLNDPTRADITNADAGFPYPSGHPMYNATIDVGDPFGGNNSLNQAVYEPGGPVQIFSHGYRNAYDVVITEDGNIFTSDNGPNGGWGGQPLIYNSDGTLKGVQGENGVTFDPGNGDYITNDFNESSSGTHGDALHYVGTLSDGDGTYYAGHPAPIQAFPSKAQVIVYQETNDTWQETARHDFADLLDGVSGYFNTSLSLGNFPDRPEGGEYLADKQNSPEVRIIDIINSSTNGITEYTATNFGGQMKGNILTASFNGKINRYKIAETLTSYEEKDDFLSGFGSQPLDVTAQGDDDPFPGTIWVAVFGSSKIVV